jgi:hypothetical protein
MPVDFNSTRKLNELAEALSVSDDDLLYLVKFPYTIDTSFRLPFGTLKAEIATLIGGGDVFGPTSSADNNFVSFDGGSGRNIKDSGVDSSFLLNRNNHTGQQPFSTITSLPTTRSGYGIVDASPFLIVQDEGITITSALLSINFVGPGVTATNLGGNVTVTVTSAGDMLLAAVQTITGSKTFSNNTLRIQDSTASFFTIINTLATSNISISIPNGTSGDIFVLESAAQSLSNKTLLSPTISNPAVSTGTFSSPQINFGFDAPGDIFYRNGAGVTSRLPAGSNSSVLTLTGGLPTWSTPYYRLLGFVSGVNLNAGAPIDLSSISISGTSYIPLYIVIYNVSASAASATLGIYTGSGGTGTTVVAPVALSSLTAAGKFQSLTITSLLNNPLVSSSLIPYLTVAAGSAATADIAVYGIQLPT